MSGCAASVSSYRCVESQYHALSASSWPISSEINARALCSPASKRFMWPTWSTRPDSATTDLTTPRCALSTFTNAPSARPVSELWVVQSNQERHQLELLSLAESGRRQQQLDIRVQVVLVLVGEVAAAIVEVDHLEQCRFAAVVEVRPGQFDVAQLRRLEGPHDVRPVADERARDGVEHGGRRRGRA